jgi:hypothetical protein
MTKHKAIKELLEIADITDPMGEYTRSQKQRIALMNWAARWLVEVQAQETVLRKEYLTSEYRDFVKTQLVGNMIDQTAEDAVEFVEKDKTIKARMYALKRGNKP